MPLCWAIRSRTWNSFVTQGSAMAKSGRCVTTRSFQAIFPSSTREATRVAVKALEVDPTWKRVWGSTGSCFPVSFTPKPFE